MAGISTLSHFGQGKQGENHPSQLIREGFMLFLNFKLALGKT
jgi:hypothetical protein